MNTTPLDGLNMLIVDDEVWLRKQLTAHMEDLGADVTSAGDLERARGFIDSMQFDFALLDVHLPDGLGTDLLREKVFSPNTNVIVMTADGGVEGAVEAMQLGALDYLVKPFEPGEVPLVIKRVKNSKQKSRLDEHQRKSKSSGFYFGRALSPLKTQLEKIISADERLQTQLPPVLIEGETGTGKTTIARWLQQHGPRSTKPFVEMNCSALPDQLAESELFGHERGAFTDAKSARIGLFEAADGGALFLDELPSLSLKLQAKVLTAIEDRKIRRLGGNREITIDARVIAATNMDLRKQVEIGEFREDLLHRLDLFRLRIPPLRERGEDVIELADDLLSSLCKRHRMAQKSFSDSGKKRLRAHGWPGNVRELAHEIERAIVFEDREALELDQLFPQSSASGAVRLPSDMLLNSDFIFPEIGISLDDTIDTIIDNAIAQSDGNVSAAARLLQVKRDYIRYRMGQKKEDGLGEIPQTDS